MFFWSACLALSVLGVLTSGHPGSFCTLCEEASRSDISVVCEIENKRFEGVAEVCENALKDEGMTGFCVLSSKDDEINNASNQEFSHSKCRERVIVHAGKRIAPNESATNTTAIVCHCATTDKRRKRDAPTTAAPATSTNRHVTRKRLKEGMTAPPGSPVALGQQPLVATLPSGITTQAPATTTKSATLPMFSFAPLIVGVLLFI